VPLGKSRWMIKGGLGYTEKHYSINKYSLGDFFTDLFLFDTPPPRDTSSISFVRFTNQYLQVPFSVAYSCVRREHGLATLAVGIDIRSDILLHSNAQIEFDDTYAQPTPATVNNFKQLYTEGATNYTVTVEPYLEVSFFVYKAIGMYVQAKPLSYYSSPLDKRFTSATAEAFKGNIGIMYDFNRKWH